MKKTGYEIAIPSYDRPETILKKTLAYLSTTNVRGRITVFLSSKQQASLYRELPPEIRVVIGVPTLRGQRAFISDYYPEGTRLFNIEDDIPGICYSPNGKRSEIIKDLHSVIESGFNLCEAAKTKIWGVCATHNPFYLVNGKVTMDLKLLSGSAFGTINEHDKKIRTTLPVKEDYERCIKYFIKYGRVVRFGNYGVKNNPYKEPGGLFSFRNPENIAQCCKLLIKTYPGLVKVSSTRSQKEFMEIQLIKQK